MEVFLEKLARSINRATGSVGAALPGILLALLKLNLIAFFLWYAWELSQEAYGIPHAWLAGLLVTISGFLFLLFGAWIFLAVLPDEWSRPPHVPARGSILPFIVLVAIPVAIIVVVSRWGMHRFYQPLSDATAHHAGRFISWLSSGF